MNNQLTARDLKQDPFEYQSLFAIRQIREYCITNKCTRAFAGIRNVYDTLCEIAANTRKEHLETYIQSITTLALTDRRTVSKHLKVLKELNLVTYPPQEINAHGQYEKVNITLLQTVDRRNLMSTANIIPLKTLILTSLPPWELFVQLVCNDCTLNVHIKNLYSEPIIRTSFLHLILPTNIIPQKNLSETSSDVMSKSVPVKKTKESQKPKTSFSYTLTLLKEDITEIIGKTFRVKPEGAVLSKADIKVEGQLTQRLMEGATRQDFRNALFNIKSDAFHAEKKYMHVTPEFVTRADKFEKWVEAGKGEPPKKVATVTPIVRSTPRPQIVRKTVVDDASRVKGLLQQIDDLKQKNTTFANARIQQIQIKLDYYNTHGVFPVKEEPKKRTSNSQVAGFSKVLD